VILVKEMVKCVLASISLTVAVIAGGLFFASMFFWTSWLQHFNYQLKVETHQRIETTCGHLTLMPGSRLCCRTYEEFTTPAVEPQRSFVHQDNTFLAKKTVKYHDCISGSSNEHTSFSYHIVPQDLLYHEVFLIMEKFVAVVVPLMLSPIAVIGCSITILFFLYIAELCTRDDDWLDKLVLVLFPMVMCGLVLIMCILLPFSLTNYVYNYTLYCMMPTMA
jgi:hypothetical protein